MIQGGPLQKKISWENVAWSSTNSLSSSAWNSFSSKSENAPVGPANKWSSFTASSRSKNDIDGGSLDFLSEFEIFTEVDATGFDSDDGGKCQSPNSKNKRRLKSNPLYKHSGNNSKSEVNGVHVSHSSGNTDLEKVPLSIKTNIPSFGANSNGQDDVDSNDEMDQHQQTMLPQQHGFRHGMALPLESQMQFSFPPTNNFPAIDVRIMQVGDRFHFVPLNDVDMLHFVELAQRNEPQTVTCFVTPGVAISPFSIGTNGELVSLKANQPPQGNPKHIYKTACDTYRVQVGKGSRKERNGKFSRNARSETDALWLCELALVINDCPPTLEDIIRSGNYRYILQKGLVTSPQEFAIKLLQQADMMHNRGLLRLEESQRAIIALRSVLPPAVLACVPMAPVMDPMSYLQSMALMNGGSTPPSQATNVTSSSAAIPPGYGLPVTGQGALPANMHYMKSENKGVVLQTNNQHGSMMSGSGASAAVAATSTAASGERSKKRQRASAADSRDAAGDMKMSTSI